MPDDSLYFEVTDSDMLFGSMDVLLFKLLGRSLVEGFTVGPILFVLKVIADSMK